MTQDEVEQFLITTICSIQEQSGREKVEVSSSTRPLVDIPDFDSLNGVEATVEAFDWLSIEGAKFNSVFTNGEKDFTVSEAAARLLKCMAEEQ